MAPNAASIAKWKSEQGKGKSWKSVAKDNDSALKDYAAKLKANPMLFLPKGADPKLVAKFSSDPTWAENNPLFKKKLHEFNAALPHRAPSSLQSTLSKIAHIAIPGAALGIAGAGIAGAASTALSSAGVDLGAVSKVTGGFGPGGPAGAIIPGEGGGGILSGISDTVDDLFGGLSKAGQYAEGWGKTLSQFKSAFGSGDDGGGGGGGGGPSQDMGPVSPAAPVASGGLPKWVPWAVGGVLALLLILAFMGRRK